MPGIFTITRSIIGPLTTVATLAEECSGCYGFSGTFTKVYSGNYLERPVCYAFELHDACAGMKGNSAPPACVPTTTNDWGFYSPGLYCPSGWVKQTLELSYGMDMPTHTSLNTTRINRALDLLTKDETAAFCCPSHYSAAFYDLQVSELGACVEIVTSGDFVVSTCVGWPSVSESTFTLPITDKSRFITLTTDEGISVAPIIQLVWRPQDWIVTSTDPPVVAPPSPSIKPPSPSPTPTQTHPPSTPPMTSILPTSSLTSTSPSPKPPPSAKPTSPSSSSSTSTSSSSLTSSSTTKESTESTKLTTPTSNEAAKTSTEFTEDDQTTPTSPTTDRSATLSTSSASHTDNSPTSTNTDAPSTPTSSENSSTRAETLSTSTSSSTSTHESAATPAGGEKGGGLSPTTTKTVTATTVTVGVLGFIGFGLWFGVFRRRRKNSSDDEHNSSNPDRAVLDGPIKPELPATTSLVSGTTRAGGDGGPGAMAMSGAGAGTTQEEKAGVFNNPQPELEGPATGGIHAGGSGGISPIAEHPGEQDHLLHDHDHRAPELTAQHGTTELEDQRRISELEEQRRRVELEEQRQRAELMAMTNTPSPAPSYSQGPYPYPYAYPQSHSQAKQHQQPYHYPDAVELESPPGWSPQSPYSPPPRPPRSPHTPGDRTRHESDMSSSQGPPRGQGPYTQQTWARRGHGHSPRQSPIQDRVRDQAGVKIKDLDTRRPEVEGVSEKEEKATADMD
ncbi:hypothetical protein V8F20_001263 [Naviculisporaceae sp. PSN 640]